jgi:hypothetical protein
MKKFVIAGALLLVSATALPGHAEDAPKAPPAPAASQTEAPPPSVARPSLAPKAAELAAPPVVSKSAEPDKKSVSDERPRQRRHARRHHGRYGHYRTAYWEPFPIYWPHFYRHRIHWNRIPWAFHSDARSW